MKETKTSEGQSKPTVSHAKTDVRHWQEKVFTRSNDEFHVQIGFGGRQERWPLKTANRAQAAAKARDIYLSLIRDGYEATRAKFKTWTVAPPEAPKAGITVGEFIAAAKAVAVVRPTTFTTYERKLRFLTAQIVGVKGTKRRHDYVHGGAEKWRGQVDSVPLAEITPQRVSEWRVRYISKFDKEPLKRQSAQQTAISILRNAKALFAPKIIRNLGVALPSPLPFQGVEIGKRPRSRYQAEKSGVNAALLVNLAHSELKATDPDAFKIFLLAFAAGLRRGEIDRLTWKNFRWQEGTISIEASEYGVNKTESSNDEIDIGPEMVSYFREQMALSKSPFVIESKAADTAAPHWNRYRCDGHFKAMLAWLRAKGVKARNPLHSLRKEFGSLINQKFGIFAASAALRHSGIAITRDHYLDKKTRTALDLGEIMASQPAAQ